LPEEKKRDSPEIRGTLKAFWQVRGPVHSEPKLAPNHEKLEKKSSCLGGAES